MINKTIMGFLFFILAFASKGQNRIGIKAGANLANVSISTSGITYSPQSITTFHIGGVLESRLTDKILLQPNLLFSQKGYLFNLSIISSKSTLDYIEFPVNLLYEIKKDFTVGGGIYAAHAIGGKIVTNGVSQDYDFRTGKANRFDLGINLIVGYEVLEGIKLNINYTHGFANMMDNVNSNVNNKVWGFSLIKLFGER